MDISGYPVDTKPSPSAVDEKGSASVTLQLALKAIPTTLDETKDLAGVVTQEDLASSELTKLTVTGQRHIDLPKSPR